MLGSLAQIFTILALYVAWVAFFVERKNRTDTRKAEKRDILRAIQLELNLMDEWVGTDYDDANIKEKQEPFHPFHMVYTLQNNESVKNSLSTKSITILSEELQELLVVLNQKLSDFSQHVERLIKYSTSSPILATKAFYYYDSKFSNYSRKKKWEEMEKLAAKLYKNQKITQEEIYLVGYMRMLKDLHVLGIGGKNDNDKLHQVYLDTCAQLKIEEKNLENGSQFKSNIIFQLIDIFVFASIPIIGFFVLCQ